MGDHIIELLTVDGQRVRVTEGVALRAVGESMADRHAGIRTGGCSAVSMAVLIDGGLTAAITLERIGAQA